MNDVEKIRKFLKELRNENVKFKHHFYVKTADRPVTKWLVKEYLKKSERLLNAEKQQTKRKREEKYKLWFKLSSRYYLVIIVSISGKHLNIITAWNTNRKWQKALKK